MRRLLIDTFVIYGSCLAFLLVLSAILLPLMPWAISVLSGMLLWSFVEYWVHRTLLHDLPRGRFRRFIAGQHILHHRDPKKFPTAIVIWTSSTVVIVILLTLMPLLGAPITFAMIAGVIFGYLCYEYTHLTAHTDCPHLTPWGAALKSHHLAHHYQSAKHNYSVVFPLWDTVFRTKLPA